MPKKKSRVACKSEPEDTEISTTFARCHASAAGPSSEAPRAAVLKLPEFWEASPAAWFAHTESLFDLHGVEDDNRRYHHVVSALPSSVATRIVGLLTHPPAFEKYAALKSQLLYNFGLSDTERADELFGLNGLGARKPSQLMEHMLALLGDHTPGFLFTQLFLRQLPVAVRSVLAGMPTTDLRALAMEADKVYIAQRGASALVSMHAPPTPQPMVRGGVAANRPGRPARRSALCFYHERFGDRATKCRQPCSFTGQGNL